MACNITAGRERACKEGIGGQSTLYLFYQDDATFMTLSADKGEVATVTAADDSIFAFPLVGDSNTLEMSTVGDRNTGTRVNTQTLTVTLPKLDAVTSAQMNLLVAGYPQAVILDKQGNYIVLGLDHGMDFTVVASTGGAAADMNGYTLSGVAMEDGLAPHMADETAIAAFIAGIDDGVA
tara:strand:+ start:724 stop:1260 length:537 start_codon:yes stop_codon:yes gene_type:complete